MPDRVVGWAALLARWTDFARSAAALPKEGEGGRLREAVASIIALQAVFHALGEIDSLAPDEYAVAQDRGEVLIREHAGAVHAIWRGEEMPAGVREIIDDARAALERTRTAGVEWVVAGATLRGEHPAELVSGLIAAGFGGDLYVPAAGVVLSRGCPAGFMREKTGAAPTEEACDAVGEFLGEVDGPSRVWEMRQAYRQWDFGAGRVVRDYVVPMSAELPGGQPLLVPAIVGGEARPVAMPIRGADAPPPKLEFAGDARGEDRGR
ncbi:MAG: hypothetical protein SFY69_12035 [Planctomycetota bacterium]|nr:hypothetical protein [Planctomycetota bacterium]